MNAFNRETPIPQQPTRCHCETDARAVWQQTADTATVSTYIDF